MAPGIGAGHVAARCPDRPPAGPGPHRRLRGAARARCATGRSARTAPSARASPSGVTTCSATSSVLPGSISSAISCRRLRAVEEHRRRQHRGVAVRASARGSQKSRITFGYIRYEASCCGRRRLARTALGALRAHGGPGRPAAGGRRGGRASGGCSPSASFSTLRLMAFGKPSGGKPSFALEQRHHRLREGDLARRVEHVVGGQVVGHHHQRHVAHHLGGGRDLDDVAEQLVDVGIGARHLGPAVRQAERARLLAQVGVLAAGHLVAVDVGGAGCGSRSRTARRSGARLPSTSTLRAARRNATGRGRARCRPAPRRWPTGWAARSARSSRPARRRPHRSRPRSPASTDAAAAPLVSWVWKWTGRPVSCFSAFTSAAAARGRQMPAMSLMAEHVHAGLSPARVRCEVVGLRSYFGRACCRTGRRCSRWRAFAQRAGLEHRVDRHAHVLDPVERVEHAEQVDAAGRRLLHEVAHHVVGIVGVANRVRAAQQHLEQQVRHRLAQHAPGAATGLPSGSAAPRRRWRRPSIPARTVAAARARSTARSAACRRCACAWRAATGARRASWCRSAARASESSIHCAKPFGPSACRRWRVPSGMGVSGRPSAAPAWAAAAPAACGPSPRGCR